MPYSAFTAVPYKKPLCAALSAVLLLSTISCVSTTSISPKNATLNATDYCLIRKNTDTTSQATDYTAQSVQQRAMNCMLNELQVYQQKDMTTRQKYFAYKAQAWLNYATHKDSMNSRSDTAVQAAQAAETILQALKNNQEQALELIEDIPSTSTLMRPDLWATLNALKDSGGIVNAPREIAFSEVALIWAATDQCERGVKSSNSHFRMADRWLEQAREAFVNAHDSKTNVTLQALIVRYYEEYAPLDSSDDTCNGQVLATIDKK
ncbi:hypothetical protein [Psychrobacter sp. ANT_WB68]|uniref:hypothetical protein n=1 Tax=Psychrobacter sp. ANT_WB68 TaxID=2597355 RepID=UPI0011F22C39|nr:hypothetical protein [Psychrobacter sp. ANT_WB68]KAA0914280.1 hypothetical protein FQ084_06825 [Psychrobacter sp. ANT_WB68]